MHLEVRGARVEPQVRQQALEAHPGPAGGADQVASHRIRDTAERDKLVERVVASEFIERKGQRFFDQTGDVQSPLLFVYGGRNGVDINAVMTFQGRKLRP